MPTRYPIRPLSWQLDPGITSLTPTFSSLKLPPHWKQVFFQLAANANPNKPYISSEGLHCAFNALFGDLISIESYAWNQQNAPKYWLYADLAHYSEPEKHSLAEALYEIVFNWADVVWSKDPQRISLLQKLKPSDLQWEEINPNLAEWGTAPNGTATPTAYAFRLIPHWIASQLSQPNVALQLGSASRELRRIPQPAGGRGVELMTWPPEKLDGRRPAYYSVVLNFSLQTVPFQSFPVINCDVSMRRWATQKPDLPYGIDTSVYLQTSVPWLSQLHHTSAFQIAPLRMVQEKNVIWSPSSHLTEILNRLHPQRPFPEANDLYKNPEKWFTPHGDQVAAIVHSTRMGTHSVGAGHFPLDRRRIAEQINDLLAPDMIWAPAPTLIKIPSGVQVKDDDKLFPIMVHKSDAPSHVQEHRRRNFPFETQFETQQEIHLEFFYQREAARLAFEHTLRTFFKIDASDSFPVALDDGRSLFFSAQHLGPLGEPLDISSPWYANASQLKTPFLRRCQEVREKFAAENCVSPLNPTLSFIELGNRAAFKGADDPKHALRAGFADCGRLTQFIALDSPFGKDTSKYFWVNAQGALLDGARQLGLGGYYPDWSKIGLPKPLQLMAFWLVRLQNTTKTRVGGLVPLFVRIDSLSGAIEVKACGFTNWLPYRQAQLAMAASSKNSGVGTSYINRVFKGSEVQAFITETLRIDIEGDTVLFCDAKNARGLWKWLQDTQITPRGIQLLENTPLESTTSWVNWSGLRVIRVRDYSNGEVPQHFSIKEDGVSQPSGLYAWQQTLHGQEEVTRVFGSIAQKPKQFAGLKLAMSRFEEDSKSVGLNAWNPRLLEIITAILQPQDTPTHWATLTHSLRDSAAHFGAETALPLPLHLAMKLEEYVLPLS